MGCARNLSESPSFDRVNHPGASSQNQKWPAAPDRAGAAFMMSGIARVADDARNGSLRQLAELDCGLRLIIATGIDAAA